MATSLALQQFLEFSALESGEEASQYLFEHPGLLNPADWPEFKAPARTSQACARAYSTLVQFAEATVPWKFPIKATPLGQLIYQLMAGDISEAAALKEVSQPAYCLNLSPLLVASISMRNQAVANNGNWSDALIVQRVLMRAIDERYKLGVRAGQEILEAIAANDYCVIAARAIGDTADGRLYRDAIRRANAVLATGVQPPWNPPGAIEYSLACLQLDPYVYRRSTNQFDLQIAAWMRAGFNRVRENLESDAEVAEFTVPPPVGAFSESARLFLASANQRTGTDRGLSLKGHLGAEAWKKVAGGEPSTGLATLAREAFSLLQDEEYAATRAELVGICHILDIQSEDQDWVAASNELLAKDLPEWIDQEGLVQATDRFLFTAGAVQQQDPGLALALWRKALPAFAEREEAVRIACYKSGLRYLRIGLAHPSVDQLVEMPSPVAAAQSSIEQANANRWPPQQLAATLISIALNSLPKNKEDEGLTALRHATSIDNSLSTEILPVLEWLCGTLHRGMASNAFEANQFGDSIRSYSLAAHHYLAAKLPEAATDALGNGLDLVHREPERLMDFVAFFGNLSAELQRQGGPEMVRRLSSIVREFMPQLCAGGGIKPTFVFLLLDLAKSTIFSSQLRAGGSLGWIDSPESRSLLKRLAKARQQAAGAKTAAPQTGGLDPQDQLTLYAATDELKDSDSPADVVHNLEVRYDARVTAELASRAFEAPRQWLAVPEHIQPQLGPETVLLTCYSGTLHTGNHGLYLFFMTRDAMFAAQIDSNFPGARVELNGSLADLNALAVASLRRHVNLDPDGKGDVSAEARAELANGGIYLPGPAQKILTTLYEQGKRHLCIYPDGPLHFLPFHLLEVGGKPLADDWTVTYLPSLDLLRPDEPAPERPTAVASFGLEFRNGVPFKLPVLVGADLEATDVAAAFGHKPFLGAAATEGEFTNALAVARRIHVATHGLLRVSAPSFQRLYLAPDQNSDGIFHSYELLRCDLRGVDLLTLSACETGLGRVDIGDNLRGMPANAFIAGARTIIATLWPVENTSSRTFFSALYKELASGKPKREAFRAAQLATRARHPQFRDWGGFQYLGRW